MNEGTSGLQILETGVTRNQDPFLSKLVMNVLVPTWMEVGLRGTSLTVLHPRLGRQSPPEWPTPCHAGTSSPTCGHTTYPDLSNRRTMEGLTRPSVVLGPVP
jgi:hypothetical protein